jgi:hypothetical protein
MVSGWRRGALRDLRLVGVGQAPPVGGGVLPGPGGGAQVGGRLVGEFALMAGQVGGGGAHEVPGEQVREGERRGADAHAGAWTGTWAPWPWAAR